MMGVCMKFYQLIILETLNFPKFLSLKKGSTDIGGAIYEPKNELAVFYRGAYFSISEKI